MLAFLKVRVDAGRRGSPNDWSSLAGLLIVTPPPPPPLFIFHQGLCIKSQTVSSM